MASVSVFDGSLAANTAGPWVALTGSTNLTIQTSASVFIELSNDGTNAMNLNSGVLANVSTQVTPSGPYTYALTNFPVGFIRARNGSSTAVTVKVYVQGD